MLEVKNIHKSFGGQEILKGVDLQVEAGDVIAILGPSGSGKTTLLRCLNFLERADQGEFNFLGQQYELNKLSRKDILSIRQEIGFVFQNYNLFNNKTVLENLLEPLVTGRQWSKEEAITRSEEVLKWVGMLDLKDRYPHQLSGGQQQRVGIARAIVPNPSLILFDEPTSALDPELVDGVLNLITKLADQGTTMVVVTHEMSFARHVADHIVFMDQGKIIEENDPLTFFQHPQRKRTQDFLEAIASY
ncbi:MULTISPECIES: amino acid ABC transporter ATP-binding protein [Aerococcus]|uniref:amino acid ABC transporter ATP-binding protein n=1 Tax=Aerococcus TaxID=1375 RepID=UPI0018A70142|nr:MULTISPECIES: amino acid ABC transporter ATP-binding protein [Aerococcus]MCY3035752.1 amino acid ABC transporter ATP-binding protein [Aerococcus sp. Group 2]MCY3039886.1 amino acid ABC transporter ATP-binding protein [Aerococcus sp. Group 2]MCY3040420.1 amino acid ABC transporter ATP-binding protein [Aerococcus sp. Group 2]MCY3043344.1 amino acid ABC transporter ATP-binding protein [Aerococcus sp. Group 2]MDK6519864.1 amino acid ABC transporter ATP-binding protein [Aerococcus urinae]